MSDFFSALWFYLVAGFKVFLLPVTTISDASRREYGLLVLIVCHLLLILLQFSIGILTPLATLLTPSTGAFAEAMQMSATVGIVTNAVGALMGMALFYVKVLLLFLICRVLLSGTGTLRTMLGSFLVLEAAVFASFVAWYILSLVFWAPGASSEPGLFGLVSQVGPIVLSLILVSFTILVARFGGGLGFGKAVLATVAFFILIIGLSFVGLREAMPEIGYMQWLTSVGLR